MAKGPTEILRRRNSEVARIRGFVDLTEGAKARRIAAVNEAARAEYTEAREAAARERVERLERTRRAVFRVPVPATATDAEAVQIHASYRAAYGDVYSSTDATGPGRAREELERVLGQAERTGEGLMARAAYHRGIDLGVQGIVDAYLAPRPAETGARDSSTEAHREADQVGGVEGMLGDGLVARALSGDAGRGEGVT